MTKNKKTNKNKVVKIKDVGREFRQRFFGTLTGGILIAFSIFAYIRLFRMDVPDGVFGQIGFAIVIIGVLAILIMGIATLCISLQDAGWDLE